MHGFPQPELWVGRELEPALHLHGAVLAQGGGAKLENISDVRSSQETLESSTETTKNGDEMTRYFASHYTGGLHLKTL